MKRLALIAPAVVVLAVTGCGSSSKSSNSSTTTTTKPAAATSGSVGTASTAMGVVLVGPNGRTLYLFEKDKTPKSTCSGGCTAVWKPLTSSGNPTAGAGVSAAKLTTSKRNDGTLQVVYAGHPLYYYVSDTKAGDTKGQNIHSFGADWYLVSTAGQKVEKKSSPKPSTGSTGSSGSSGSSSGRSYGSGYP